jgi:integrase
VVRSPRFEPGSSAWQADVLDHSRDVSHLSRVVSGQVNTQTRLRPHSEGVVLTSNIKTIPPEIDSRIATTLIKMENNGLTSITVKHIEYSLKQLAQHSNLLDPEEVKQYVAHATTNKNKQPVAQDTKNRWCYSYDKFCKVNNIQWEKPYYKVEEKAPLIPTKDNVNAIINNASKKYATIFTILAEIGCEGHELETVTQRDIDAENGIIRICGCKGHASGTYKLKTQTATMLRVYLANNPQEHPFPTSQAMRQIWIDTRRRAAKKLCKPELDKIPCKNLRNYSGAMLYLTSPVRDPIAVMRHLRHKKLETTMHYIRAIVLDDSDEKWTCRMVATKEEASALIEEGFTYVQTIGDTHLYRKRKQTQ